jgi:hypothetical protein
MKKFLREAAILAARVWGYLDSELILAESQAATAVGDTASTNYYDSGNAVLGDFGQTGENLWVQALCSTTATSGGAATLQAVLQDSADNVTYNDVLVGGIFALASIVAGAVLLQVQPPPGMRRYSRVVWRIGTAVLTAGKFDAFVSNTIQRNVARPSGIPAVG